MRDRSEQTYAIANECYNHVRALLKEKDVDAGVGIAVCQLVGSWLVGSAAAQTVVADPSLANVKYFGDGSGDGQE